MTDRIDVLLLVPFVLPACIWIDSSSPEPSVGSDADGDADVDGDVDADEPWCPDPSVLWGTGTMGEAGAAEFILWSCPFGCGLERPLATGTSEAIAVDVGETDVELVSETPEVLSVSTHEDCVDRPELATVTGLTPGDATLVLRDSEGVEIDRVSWSVRAPATLEVRGDDGIALPAGEPLQLLLGDEVLLGATLRDESGAELFSSLGVHWSLPDQEVATIGLEPDANVRYAIVNVHANAVGSTSLRVEASGLSADVSIVVSAGM